MKTKLEVFLESCKGRKVGNKFSKELMDVLNENPHQIVNLSKEDEDEYTLSSFSEIESLLGIQENKKIKRKVNTTLQVNYEFGESLVKTNAGKVITFPTFSLLYFNFVKDKYPNIRLSRRNIISAMYDIEEKNFCIIKNGKITIKGN